MLDIIRMIMTIIVVSVWSLEAGFLICFNYERSGIKSDFIFSSIVLGGVFIL